jgi:hypothetical protein
MTSQRGFTGRSKNDDVQSGMICLQLEALKDNGPIVVVDIGMFVQMDGDTWLVGG